MEYFEEHSSIAPNLSTDDDQLTNPNSIAHHPMANGTPIRNDAFELTDDEKIDQIEANFQNIMDILGLDMTDDSLQGTPRRVAKMFVREIFSGLNPDAKPSITLFENKFKYRQMLIERNIKVQSTCEHHFLPIFGKAHVAYIPNGKVIGLSKLNRIVEYYSRRPQVQERLTVQVADELASVLHTNDRAVFIEARHMCVEARGVEHHGASTVSTEFRGKFLNENVRNEFLRLVEMEKKNY